MTDIHTKLEDRYGMTMTIEEIGEVLRMKPKPILNSISAGRFPIHTFMVGRRRLAFTDDVADYLESKKSAA